MLSADILTGVNIQPLRPMLKTKDRQARPIDRQKVTLSNDE